MDNNFNNNPNNQDAQNTYTQPGNAQPYNYENVNTNQTDTNYQQYQENYNYNVGNNYNPDLQNNENKSVVSTGEWILMLILMGIPCVNLILCFVWGFGSNVNANKKNFCRAQLILIAIGAVIGILISIVFGGVIAAMISSGEMYY